LNDAAAAEVSDTKRRDSGFTHCASRLLLLLHHEPANNSRAALIAGPVTANRSLSLVGSNDGAQQNLLLSQTCAGTLLLGDDKGLVEAISRR
jgi:hypothetical protein